MVTVWPRTWTRLMQAQLEPITRRRVGLRYLATPRAASTQPTVAGALYGNTVGDNNTAGGFQSLYNSLGGSENTAIGSQALMNTIGDYNTANGFQALR